MRQHLVIIGAIGAALLLMVSEGLAQGTFRREGAAGKNYICQLEGVVWNQKKPCDQATPERAEVLKRIAARPPQAAPQREIHNQPDQSPTIVTLNQVRLYPDRLVGENLELRDVWIYGFMNRDESEISREGESSVFLIEDEAGARLFLNANDGVGYTLSRKLTADHKYFANRVALQVRFENSKYQPFLSSVGFARGESEQINIKEVEKLFARRTKDLRREAQENEQELKDISGEDSEGVSHRGSTQGTAPMRDPRPISSDQLHNPGGISEELAEVKRQMQEFSSTRDKAMKESGIDGLDRDD